MTKNKISNEDLKKLAQNLEQEQFKNKSEEEIKKIKENQEKIKSKNISILNDTLDILKNKEDFQKMQDAIVYLPKDIDILRNKTNTNNKRETPNCNFNCENIDVLVLAQKMYQKIKKNKILILNLASATFPGGKVRDGANAQEEELCRRTSLLLSLESDKATKYYDYNNKKETHMGTDAILISPYVNVIKDSSGNLLNNPFNVSVMSCSAPMIRLGLEGMSKKEYENMLYKRIEGLFIIAASLNYRNLILGAFGCGIYGNDAATVANIFYEVINNFSFNGKNTNELFDNIDFAILSKPDDDYNYKEFCKFFTEENS